MAQTDTLASALAKAQGEMRNAPLNKVNPHFKSKYADLAAVRDAVAPVLAKHGLAVTQTTALQDGVFVLLTTLRHSSGEIVESVYPLPMVPEQPQKMGSALSYARRYSLAAMVGIASDEDDDANAAQTPAKPKQNGKPQQGNATGKPPEEVEPPPVPAKPGVIPTPDDDGDKPRWQAWAREVLNVVNGCQTLDECNEWLRHNGPGIQHLTRLHPKMGQYLNKEIAARRNTLGQAPQAEAAE